MTRIRRREARTASEEREWELERPYVLRHHPGDLLLESSIFWRREPDVPDALREDVDRWRHLLAPPAVATAILARRAELLAARAAWLAANDYR